ncbi:hypothetical protein [Nitrosovibrio sp. Nv6]|uniref:hypothetical protein n=1 Tax=Nitrosovibrio sp. Nv6 TaxID=1855340 RepID=UPI000B820F81|nr:hypothetical protein [Nitrosovibrio sp. Nv6]
MYIKNLSANEALRHIGIDRALQESAAWANESELLALAGTTSCCLKIRRRQGLGDAQKRHSLSLVVLVSNASAECFLEDAERFRLMDRDAQWESHSSFRSMPKEYVRENRWFYQDC